MRLYEFALVLTEEAGKDDKSYQKQISELLEGQKGIIKESKILGVKPLAYSIKGQVRGWYGVFKVELLEDKLDELEKQVKMNSNILRHLLIRAESKA